MRASLLRGRSIPKLTHRRVCSHKVFSTQFDNPLRAALAIDTALATTAPVSWVPSLHPDLRAHGSDSDSDEDDNESDEGGNGWITKASSARVAGGLAVVQILRRGLRYIAPIAEDGESLRVETSEVS